eukprot:1326281-Rhodomonas_salina.1
MMTIVVTVLQCQCSASARPPATAASLGDSELEALELSEKRTSNWQLSPSPHFRSEVPPSLFFCDFSVFSRFKGCAI